MPDQPKTLAELISAIGAIDEWLRAEAVPSMFIGGVAAALHGEPRMTVDVDAVALVPESRLPQIVESAAHFGIVPRVSDCVEFALKSRVLLLIHESSGVPIDVSIGLFPMEEEATRRALPIAAFGLNIRVVHPVDLVVMKVVAGRPHDLSDVRGILIKNPQIDRQQIRAIIAQYAEAMEEPQLVQLLKSIFDSVPT